MVETVLCLGAKGSLFCAKEQQVSRGLARWLGRRPSAQVCRWCVCAARRQLCKGQALQQNAAKRHGRAGSGALVVVCRAAAMCAALRHSGLVVALNAPSEV